MPLAPRRLRNPERYNIPPTIPDALMMCSADHHAIRTKHAQRIRTDQPLHLLNRVRPQLGKDITNLG